MAHTCFFESLELCGSGDCTQNAELHQLQDENVWSIFVLTGIPVITTKFTIHKQHWPNSTRQVKVSLYVLQPDNLTGTLCQYAESICFFFLSALALILSHLST